MSDAWDMPSKPGAGIRPRCVLDTDTYNEIDDQFALAYLVRSSDRVETEAIYAAPFVNSRAATAAEGMERSYEEIERLLGRLDSSDLAHARGATAFLSETGKPAASQAATDLIERAMSATHSDRLVVIGIGALTNIASALLLEPEITERIAIVWLGGHHPSWPDQREFNLTGDVRATQVVFDSGAPLYVVPALGVASHLLTCREELAAHLDMGSPLASFLYERFAEYGSDGVWAKEIWDISAVAWLVLPDAVKSYAQATPRVAGDGSYIIDPRRPPCRFAYQLDRNEIFRDLFGRLA